MNPKTEVYLLRIWRENGCKISLREIGGEQSHCLESLEALLHYLEDKYEVPSEDDKTKGGKT